MTVIKLTRSGKGILVIDDGGSVFVTSKHFVDNLSGNRVVLLKRLPFSVDEGRFKKSPLYDPDGLAKQGGGSPQDGLDKKFVKMLDDKKFYEDEVVW